MAAPLDGDIKATVDQSAAALKDLAPAIAQFYTALLAQGLLPVDAALIVGAFLSAPRQQPEEPGT